MTGLEDLIRDTLAAHESGAPHGEDLLGRVQARTARRRRVVAVGTAAAGVAAVIAGAVVVAPGATRAPAPIEARPTPGPSLPADTRSVSFHGIEVRVPASWEIRPTSQPCGGPYRDTVLVEGDLTVTTACSVVKVPGRADVPRPTVVRIGTAGHADTRLVAVARRPVVVDGQRALRGTGKATDGPGTVSVLLLPSLDVVVSVEASDAAVATPILGSVQVAPVDSNGCVDRTDMTTRPHRPGRPGAAGTLVPGRPVRAAVCRYEDGWLAFSAPVPATELATAVGVLNRLPAEVSRQVPAEGGDLCGRDARSGFVVRFFYATGPALDVHAQIFGCGDLGASNGARTTKVDLPLVGFLTSKVGGLRFRPTGFR